MSTIEIRPAFRRQVRAVARRMWLLQVARGAAWATVTALALVATVATADYFLELSYAARAGVLAGLVAAAAVVVARLILRPAATWGGGRTAVVLEGLFPRLGQRLRTTMQFGPLAAVAFTAFGVLLVVCRRARMAPVVGLPSSH